MAELHCVARASAPVNCVDTELNTARQTLKLLRMGIGLPTLSQIQGWDVDHLTAAAEHWTGTANRWENTFVEVWQQSQTMPWEGHSANALRERTHTDKTMVAQKANQLREAATIARRGASDISTAQRKVLYAVEDAHKAGFRVGEDLSVTDTRGSRSAAERAARKARAQAFAADIRSRTAALSALDNEVGANITATAGGLGTNTFVDPGVYHKSKGSSGYVQFIDHNCTADQRELPQVESETIAAHLSET
jgi:hypothetical protein